MIVQAQPVSLWISLAASSIVRGSLSMFLYNTDIKSEGCGVKFLTSAVKHLDARHRLLLLNLPYIFAETPPLAP